MRESALRGGVGTAAANLPADNGCLRCDARHMARASSRAQCFGRADYASLLGDVPCATTAPKDFRLGFLGALIAGLLAARSRARRGVTLGCNADGQPSRNADFAPLGADLNG
jgi:hypothetical protein